MVSAIVKKARGLRGLDLQNMDEDVNMYRDIYIYIYICIYYIYVHIFAVNVRSGCARFGEGGVLTNIFYVISRCHSHKRGGSEGGPHLTNMVEDVYT